MGADVSQLRVFAADLRTESGRVGTKGALVIRAVAARIERDARILAPVDTGALRNSVTTTTTGDGRSARATAEIGPTQSYGGYVELGTSRALGQPYLFPAADRHEPAFYSAVAQIIDL